MQNEVLMRRRASPPPVRLTAEQERALAAFLAGRLPAGRLTTELARGRAEPPPPEPTPARRFRLRPAA